MGTRSRIAIKLDDNSIKSVYCHWDGYPKHNGRILFNYYNNKNAALNIIELGDMSSLHESLEKPEGHSYNTPVEGCSVFYGRDRGESSVEAIKNNSIDGLITTANNCDAEWIYMFDCEKNKWLFVSTYKAYNTKSKDRINMWSELTHENTKNE